jgi:hypothetical protein
MVPFITFTAAKPKCTTFVSCIIPILSRCCKHRNANNGSVSGEYIYIQNAQLDNGSSVGVYTPTIGTPQTSPVLLPQGLTANKDITGVNAFESARNPYALNLDGASWAEVHDNASLDFGTGSFTLEAWVKCQIC